MAVIYIGMAVLFCMTRITNPTIGIAVEISVSIPMIFTITAKIRFDCPLLSAAAF